MAVLFFISCSFVVVVFFVFFLASSSLINITQSTSHPQECTGMPSTSLISLLAPQSKATPSQLKATPSTSGSSLPATVPPPKATPSQFKATPSTSGSSLPATVPQSKATPSQLKATPSTRGSSLPATVPPPKATPSQLKATPSTSGSSLPATVPPPKATPSPVKVTHSAIIVSDSPCKPKEPMWINELNLTLQDKELLENESYINDQIIYWAQKLLEKEFPDITGWQSTLCAQRKSLFVVLPRGSKFVQIMLTRNNHWVTISNIQDEGNAAHVSVYDSLRRLNVEAQLIHEVASFVHTDTDKLHFNIRNVNGQINSSDCGIYAIAYATELAFGGDPTICSWRHAKMRPHLKSCVEDKKMTPFPSSSDRLVRSKDGSLNHCVNPYTAFVECQMIPTNQ